MPFDGNRWNIIGYDAGADANQWTPLLAGLTTCFRGVGAALLFGDAESSFSFGAAYKFDPEALKAYEDLLFLDQPSQLPFDAHEHGQCSLRP